MKSNIGTFDRILRLIIGCILLVLAWMWSSWLLFLAALFAFFEALIGWCILYQILGKSSCPKK